MPALDQHLDQLAAATRWNYRAARESAAEPAAWTAIALASHGRIDAARRSADWLAEFQQANGAVGVTQRDQEPCWPAALAMLAWSIVDQVASKNQFESNVARAVEWATTHLGKPAPRSPEVGHDSTIVAWSWAADTHSWLEPTCMFVLGLRAAGLHDQPRTREGVRLIVDRLLPAGGANYGNTIVLGQALLPHVQPSGMAMTALAGEMVSDPRVERTLDYLAANAIAGRAPISLAWAVMGLTAHGRRPAIADQIVNDALESVAGHEIGPLEQSLLVLAALPSLGWLASKGEAA